MEGGEEVALRGKKERERERGGGGAIARLKTDILK